MCFFKTALKKYVNSDMQHEIIPLVTIMYSQNKKNERNSLKIIIIKIMADYFKGSLMVYCIITVIAVIVSL